MKSKEEILEQHCKESDMLFVPSADLIEGSIQTVYSAMDELGRRMSMEFCFWANKNGYKLYRGNWVKRNKKFTIQQMFDKYIK